MTTAKLAALAAAETLLNQALRHDPATRLALQKLAGKVLHLQMTQPQFDIYLCPRGDAIDVQGECALPVHCQVRGALTDLVKLAGGEQVSLAGSGVQVTGQTQLLLDVKQILANVDIDWEDWLASYLGDEITSPLVSNLRRAARFGKTQMRDAQLQLEPYLTEELQLLPSRTALTDFGEAVDQLALATDRLEARLHVLVSQLTTKP
jgi:ubiquinone biosynthesis protein UbiJ